MERAEEEERDNNCESELITAHCSVSNELDPIAPCFVLL